MWSVDISEVEGKFVVRTTYNAEIHEMEFLSEGFAKLYARGQRVHYQVLEEIRSNEVIEQPSTKSDAAYPT